MDRESSPENCTLSPRLNVAVLPSGKGHFMTIKQNWLPILALVYWTAQIIRAALS